MWVNDIFTIVSSFVTTTRYKAKHDSDQNNLKLFKVLRKCGKIHILIQSSMSYVNELNTLDTLTSGSKLGLDQIAYQNSKANHRRSNNF